MLAALIGLVLFQTPPPQEPLADLIKRIPQVTVSRDHGISDEQQLLAKKFQAYEARAIPELLPLLEDPDEVVRGFVGYVLRDIHGIEEKHLDALIRARQSGNGWIPPAIAHVGTPKAIAFLVEDLKAHPQKSTQVTWALVNAGEKAVLALAESFQAAVPLDEEYADCVCEVFHEMGERAAPAIDVLLVATRQKALPPANRRLAVESIGCIGLAGRRTIPELRILAAGEPELFSEAVERAIVGIGSPEAALILAKQLGGGWDLLTLRDIAALRENGFAAGLEVLADLAATNPDTRVAAARTLGYIGYSAAVEALVRETSQSDDWKLANAAVEALGRLGAGTAVPALQWVAANYWYPPVRSAARKALAVIHGTSTYVSSWHPSNFAFEFLDDVPEEREQMEQVRMPRLMPGPDSLTESELAQHSYTLEQQEYGSQRTIRSQARAGCGLRVAGGLLLGATRGEWGGEVVYLKSGGVQQTVLDENTTGLHRTPVGIIAVTGLAHMSMERGILYRIDSLADGSYKATWWKRLPGEPSRSGLLDDGTLVVACRGGTIAVSPKGEIGMANTR